MLDGLSPMVFDDEAYDQLNSQDKSLQETARQGLFPVLDVQDATKLVSTGTLVLGITFIITTLALYAYYYATTFDFTTQTQNRSFKSNRSGAPVVDSFPSILNDLEKALKDFGISSQSQGCRRKVVCQALLPESREKNQRVTDKLAEILNRGFVALHSYKGKSTPEKEKLDMFLKAARTGHRENSCQRFEELCKEINIEILPK